MTTDTSLHYEGETKKKTKIINGMKIAKYLVESQSISVEESYRSCGIPTVSTRPPPVQSSGNEK